MKIANAKKLHNEDEITIKRTNEVTTVIDAWLSEDKKTMFIECCTSDEGLVTLTHKEIK